jgi:hypothetical protein
MRWHSGSLDSPNLCWDSFLGPSDWDPAIGTQRLGSSDWDPAIGIQRLGSSDWDPCRDSVFGDVRDMTPSHQPPAIFSFRWVNDLSFRSDSVLIYHGLGRPALRCQPRHASIVLECRRLTRFLPCTSGKQVRFRVGVGVIDRAELRWDLVRHSLSGVFVRDGYPK